jgi:hypothetical protein
MRLEHLCDLELTYRREPLYEGLSKLVAPYGTREGSLYGEGEVVLRGARRGLRGARARRVGRRLPGAPPDGGAGAAGGA